jgi:uncharacterized protein YndB with AHSA1/START domain
MAESRFVYVTYIRTTPEKLWQALFDPEFTRRYFKETWQESDWHPGASWRMVAPGGEVINTGEVLEIEPARRLVVSWRHERPTELHEEGYSRCTFELEPQTSAVKLTVVHEIDKPESKLIKSVSGGWPLFLSSLKSMLESGEPLEESRYWGGSCAGASAAAAEEATPAPAGV